MDPRWGERTTMQLSTRPIYHSLDGSRSPLRSPRHRKPAVSRGQLYKAPQASIRNGDSFESDEKQKGNTRRRKVMNEARGGRGELGSAFSLERQKSDRSLNSEGIPPPPLFNENEADEYAALTPNRKRELLAAGIPEIHWRQKTPPPPHPKAGMKSMFLQIQQGNEDFSYSECLDDESNRPFLDQSKKPSRLRVLQSFFSYANVIQLLVLVVLAGIVFDGHNRVKRHKIQVQRFDEERSHILEQMMWIDQAAKRVHKKYAEQVDLDAETKDELKEDVVTVRHDLEQLQLRIQLNARDHIYEQFRDNPVQVSLPLTPDGTQHLVIGLSDDTPHAAYTFLQQIRRKLWDQLQFERSSNGSIIVSSKEPTTKPLLEFVEKSRGCREIGSVSVRQLEQDQLHIMVLQIILSPTVGMDDNDVCIGRVIQGLELLEGLASA